MRTRGGATLKMPGLTPDLMQGLISILKMPDFGVRH